MDGGEREASELGRDFPGEQNEPFMKPLGLKRWLSSFTASTLPPV